MLARKVKSDKSKIPDLEIKPLAVKEIKKDVKKKRSYSAAPQNPTTNKPQIKRSPKAEYFTKLREMKDLKPMFNSEHGIVIPKLGLPTSTPNRSSPSLSASNHTTRKNLSTEQKTRLHKARKHLGEESQKVVKSDDESEKRLKKYDTENTNVDPYKYQNLDPQPVRATLPELSVSQSDTQPSSVLSTYLLFRFQNSNKKI
eukprot:TRINITY_DN12421_c0_g1_i1.p1 TRINITY_DN12421_c0_g1~~TRINITY_DN12421_c0_g1_i1.p1  ORF type:complete len:200 (+),score=31.68 TRINITY_DN12421_c0_g1_i1:94-693(+)